MYTLNNKIINLVPYEPISGTYNIRLDANECPDNLPDFIRDEIKAEIDRLAFNRYPDPMANSVVEAFASYYGVNPAFVTAGRCSSYRQTSQCTIFTHRSARLSARPS